MSDIVPRSEVTKSGVKGVGAVVGGTTLLVLSAITQIPVIGVIAGAVLAVVGFSLTTSRPDRTAGAVTAIAGIVTAVASLFPSLRWLIWVPGLGLIGTGVYLLFKFFRGMKTRT
jgi:hypothetical protein